VESCLVLGAGASLADAQHFRRERGLDSHPPLDTTFFQKIEALDLALHPALRAYVRRLTGSDPSPRLLATQRMEEFFKDVYYDFQSNSREVSLRRAYIELVRLYTAVLRETTNWLCEDSRGGAPVGKLIADAADASTSTAVVTFNHDLVIENDIYKRRRLRKRWCIETTYGDIAEGMTLSRSGVAGGDFPRHADDCNHSKPIMIYKLHGSLNWVFRLRGQLPTERQLTGVSTPSEFFLTQRRQIPARLRYSRARSGRGRTTWYTWPLIIPPIYAKQALIHLVDPAWAAARRSVASCDRLVFFGYSLPPADIEAEKLFQRAITANRNLAAIDVINPDPMSASRFASLVPSKPVRWFPSIERFDENASFA
jgi:hypothetical protein